MTEFRNDFSDEAATQFNGGSHTAGFTMLEHGLEAIKLIAQLTPRNRYLLLRSLWVLFDLDKQLPAEGETSDQLPGGAALEWIRLIENGASYLLAAAQGSAGETQRSYHLAKKQLDVVAAELKAAVDKGVL